MILIINMNSKENNLAHDEFVKPIAKLIKDYEVKPYLEVDKKTAQKYEKIILSGTALKDNEFMKNIEKFSWIKTCNKPILGICAGMQAIALVFGSKTEKCTEIGLHKITTKKQNMLFSGEFEAYELHNYAVIPSEYFEVLAESEKCCQAIKHKEKDIYGVMFHPEVRNEAIISLFVS